jgi:sporulation related protein
MSYIRYNPRGRKSNNGGMLIFMLTLILVVILGSLVYKIFKEKNINLKIPKFSIGVVKGKNKNEITKESNNDINAQETSINDENKGAIIVAETTDFYAIQCGAFKSQENADICRESVLCYGNPFITESNDFYKVILGVYKEDEVNEIISKLDGNQMEWSKVKFQINKDSLCNNEIIEIINANLSVISKLSESNVEAIETKDLKEWTKALNEVEPAAANYNCLINLEKNINVLPSKLTKETIPQVYRYVFENMNKIKN